MIDKDNISGAPHEVPRWRRIAPLQWLASVTFTALLFLLSPVWGAVITLFGWLPFRGLYHFARGWAGSNMWLAKILCGLDWVVEGRENIPQEGAHISMWKHTSTWETMAQMVVMPPQAWVLKREILWIPLVGWATWMLKCMRSIAAPVTAPSTRYSIRDATALPPASGF